MDLLILAHVVILAFLVATALAAVMSKDLLEAVIIYSAYSFTIAFTYSILRAVDVSMTEAAVGAGISSILFAATLCKTKRRED
ncbi:MAG: hydrogenase subunit MbhD domain-containing protein [bacterium]